MTHDDSLDGPYAFLIISGGILALSGSAVWHAWDHNGDGVFTIRDLLQLAGDTLSMPYVYAYEAAPDLVRFFEIAPPFEASSWTVLAGLLVGFATALLGGRIVGGLAGWVRKFPAHWRR